MSQGPANARLEELTPGAKVRGALPNGVATVVGVKWLGSEALELTCRTPEGQVADKLLYRDDEARLEVVEQGRPWSFDGDGALFRLVSEALRIRLAHLFDPMLAVHTSRVEPLPHQITAVYGEMLPRQPLRFLLADDPGAGKTIMAGLLMKELIARGDLERCLVVCPGALAEQWQDELADRFDLPFELLTNDKLKAARTGNWFMEADLIIARLDKLSRNEDVQEKLKAPDCRWDLVVCDEAHKMSATYFGGEVKYTKRHKLGQLLSGVTRHFLLMTATPHNGKEQDFQLFMSLLDGDRFEGRFRDGAHATDVSDIMRRVVKEGLLRFDGTPLFPERKAHTVPYKLSDAEAHLYAEVTQYVREEFNRAEALENNRRAGNVGFALTILQRRLASSPAAIHHSLRRRRERLESQLREAELVQRGAKPARHSDEDALYDSEALADLEDAPEIERQAAEAELLSRATAARTIPELRQETAALRRLERLAAGVLRSGNDAKWQELADVFRQVFTSSGLRGRVMESAKLPYSAGEVPPHTPSTTQKLVIFTEHRDTLDYLQTRIATLLGRPGSLVVVHGSMGRTERLKAQEAFRHDPETQVLLATDAAGEGVNLQRAHLMVNYDLPWNPNRIEQRFGRIHRIGQREVCHLWNLVAAETREGNVYRRLLEKLEQAREALGGKVFDVLGKLHFEGRPLRDLLTEAVRYGERPDVRSRLDRVVEHAMDRDKLRDLVEDEALAHGAIDARKLHRVREEMERADARRLQPHYVESFFVEAFGRLGGKVRQREPRRYEVTHVPAVVRARDRLTGAREPVLSRYERIVFDKETEPPVGRPPAAFVCPGHPLLDAVLDLTLERHRELLKRGTVLVDDRDAGGEPRVLFYLEHALQDGGTTQAGDRRIVSKKVLHVEMEASGRIWHLDCAPYLDYRPLDGAEPDAAAILDAPEFAWVHDELEARLVKWAVEQAVPRHLEEVRKVRHPLVDKTRAAVKARLTKEINYWDHRAQELKAREEATRSQAASTAGSHPSADGKRASGVRLASGEAAKRADALQLRLRRRLAALDLECHISPCPPVVLGGVLVVPGGLLEEMGGRACPEASDPSPAAPHPCNEPDAAGQPDDHPEASDQPGASDQPDSNRQTGTNDQPETNDRPETDNQPGTAQPPVPPAFRPDTQAAAARAREAVMEVERALGFKPVDREFDRLGYDIESRVPGTGKLRFIEVKGRVSGARDITVTRNEILCSLNKPDDYILAIVEFLDEAEHRVRYLRRPFQREPDFGVTSVNYDFADLLARAVDPS